MELSSQSGSSFLEGVGVGTGWGDKWTDGRSEALWSRERGWFDSLFIFIINLFMLKSLEIHVL